MTKLIPLIVAILAGCASTGAPASAAPAAPPAAPGPGQWETWSRQQKLAYMRSTFMEAERKVFTEFEPFKFAKLDCKTCHGQGVFDGTFKMPNPDLPKLVGGAEGFGELARQEPKMLAFMQKRVVPETARLLGVPEFDFASHQGFSCFQCHTRSDR